MNDAVKEDVLYLFDEELFNNEISTKYKLEKINVYEKEFYEIIMFM